MKKVTAFVGSGHKRLTHNAVRQFLDDLESFGDVETEFDYGYYTDKGWFDSDYFYPVRLDPMKKAAGRFFDAAQARKARKRKK